MRMLAVASAALTGGVDVWPVGVAVPAAFRFFGFVVLPLDAAPGAESLAVVWLFALEWAPLVATDSFARFASVLPCAFAAEDAFFL